MAKRSPILVGVDIEPSAVHAAVVTTNGGLTVKHAGSVPLEAGVVRDGEVADVEALSEALKTLFREHSDLDKRVRLGVANQKIVVRTIELPPIADKSELAAAVRFQAQDEIPMPLDSAVLDFQPLDVVDTPSGPRQRIVLVAARRDMVERVLLAARTAGLRPEGIDLSAFAMVRALHSVATSHGAGSEPVLYLSIGGLTNLAVAEGTTCTFTRVVGGGLEAVAVELAERRGLTLVHARGWLEHVGLEGDVEAVDGDPAIVTEARVALVDGVRRIAGEVRNTIDFHLAQGAGHSPVSQCVLTGSAIGVPGFADALQSELGLTVHPGVVPGVPDALGPGALTVAAGLSVEAAA